MKKELSDSLDDAIKNKELIEILKNTNKENCGFILGKIEYFDDIHIIDMYGITLDKQDNSKPKIFSFTISPPPVNIENGYNFKLGNSLSDLSEFNKFMPLNGEYPSTKEIQKRTKDILNNPEKSIINYSRFLPSLSKE